jgi:hypothetical protein
VRAADEAERRQKAARRIRPRERLSLRQQKEAAMTDNQHRQIKGYRELDENDIALMNEIKSKGAELGDLVEKLRAIETTDKRWVSIGATDLQTGLMALTRSVAKPTFF